jgi:hypothetical protein
MSQAMGQSSRELLDSFCAHQQEARSKIHSYSLSMSTSRLDSDNEQKSPIDSVYKEIRQGDSFWFENTRLSHTIDKTDKENASSVETQVLVCNDDYVAVWDKSASNAQFYENLAKKVMAEDGITAVKLGQPVDLLKFGYGDGDRMLSEAIADTSIAGTWNARSFTSQSGLNLYLAERVSSQGRDKEEPELQCVIDPQKSFLITRVIAYHPNGAVRIDDEISIEEITPGVFFPTHVVMRSYANDGGDEFRSLKPVSLDDILSNRYLASYDSVKHQRIADHKVTEIKTSIEVKPEQFTMDALGIPADIDFIKKAPDGTLTMLKKVGNRWVDEEVANAIASGSSVALENETNAKKTITPPPSPEPQRVNAEPHSEKTESRPKKLNVALAVGLGGVLLIIAATIFLVTRHKRD